MGLQVEYFEAVLQFLELPLIEKEELWPNWKKPDHDQGGSEIYVVQDR